MSTPFIGEIRMFGGSFAPQGWAMCDGRLVAISDNEVLFVLIGTTYGGDGQNTFALPDFRGRAPMHQGQGPGLSNRVIGSPLGTETVGLLPAQVPAHSHALFGDQGTAVADSPVGNIPAASANQGYSDLPPDTALAANAIPPAGSGIPHENRPPFVAVTYIISLFGVFPSQN